jgi:hypothetical protein
VRNVCIELIPGIFPGIDNTLRLFIRVRGEGEKYLEAVEGSELGLARH